MAFKLKTFEFKMMDMNNTEPKTMPKNIYEFAAEERKFLHDLSNPLAIATGMLEAYRDELDRSGAEPTEALTRKLSKLDSALQRIADIITNHRPRIMEIQATDEKNKPC